MYKILTYVKSREFEKIFVRNVEWVIPGTKETDTVNRSSDTRGLNSVSFTSVMFTYIVHIIRWYKAQTTHSNAYLRRYFSYLQREKRTVSRRISHRYIRN